MGKTTKSIFVEDGLFFAIRARQVPMLSIVSKQILPRSKICICKSIETRVVSENERH